MGVGEGKGDEEGGRGMGKGGGEKEERGGSRGVCMGREDREGREWREGRGVRS